MAKIVSLLLLLILNLPQVLTAQELEDFIKDPVTQKNIPLYRYQYVERDHSLQENAKNIGLLYGVAWIVYPIFQPKLFSGAGGWRDYKRNFGQLVFDKDEPVWNFFIHPLTGSQLYLLFRADGYSRMGAFGMTTITSTLFEFTVEIFTEPASIQDLYQTPVLGSVFGLGLENFSFYLLNGGTSFGKIIGHLINPATLMPFYQGRTLIIPKLEPEDKGAMLKLEVSF